MRQIKTIILLFVFSLCGAALVPATGYAQSEKPSLFNKFLGSSSQNEVRPYDLGQRKARAIASGPTMEERRTMKKQAQMQQMSQSLEKLQQLANSRVQKSMQLASAQAGNATPSSAQGGSKKDDNKVMVYDPDRYKNRSNRPSLYNQP